MPARIEFSKADIRHIVTNYEAGYSMADLAAEYNVTMPVIRRILTEAGETIRPRGRHPQV